MPVLVKITSGTYGIRKDICQPLAGLLALLGSHQQIDLFHIRRHSEGEIGVHSPQELISRNDVERQNTVNYTT